jgi:hypothetical protein
MSISGPLLTALLIPFVTFGETGAEAFANLQQLAGVWEGRTARGSLVRVSYRTISAKSALVETFTTSSGSETLTIYHADGPNLIATHYCAQGNQPRLRLEAGNGRTTFQLAFHDATNLAGPDSSHLIRLKLELTDAGQLERTEVYSENGKDDVTVLRFVRTSQPGAAH